LLFVLVVPATARAHEPVFTLKYVDGRNIILASSNVHDITAGQPITFNLRVYTIAGVPVVYKSVESVVKHDGEVVFDRTMAASDDNDVNWIYAFDKAGEYDVTLHFANHDEHLARAHFPIAVAGNGKASGQSPSARIVAWPTAAALLLGVGLTLGAQWLFKRPGRGRKQAATHRSDAASTSS
jgi:hypothetical protein